MRTVGLIALVILFPAFAHAAVSITEIMYDLSGTDTGREWVEITNTGNSAVDVSGYKFFEANVNHSLSLIAGTGTLQAGSSAIIADDATKFKIDWPSYSGMLFDSSFSLSNTGESVSLKDGALTVLDSVSYDPSLGAAGDGNTLQWNGSTFAPTTPTPGTYSGSGDTGGSGDTATTTPASSGSSGGGPYTPIPSSIVVKISSAQKAFMEVPMILSARATSKGGVVDPSAQIVWSFGDGSSATGIEVTKIYHYAGTYVVTVIANNGMAKARDEIIISVTPALVRILSVSSEGIMITNDSDERLDLSQWRLFSSVGSFRIPDGTTILSEASVLFPSAITNLPIAFDATLSYPNGVVAARYTPAPLLAASVPVVDEQPISSEVSYKQVQKVEPIISTRTNVQSYDEAVNAPAPVSIKETGAGAAVPPVPSLAAAVTAKTPATGLFHSVWTLGLLGVITLAGGAFILL